MITMTEIHTGQETSVPLTRVLAILLACGGAAAPAMAHFQQIIPGADVLPDGGRVVLDLVFTHPVEAGPVMDMARPEAVGVMAGGTVTDLAPALVEALRDGAMAWQVSHDLAEPGAAAFFVTPQPYWEPAEGKFIVHHAKVIVDSYASGDGWDALAGLPVEIAPLTRPTGLWAGNAFRGVVLRNGTPVPFAEIEVEFVNDGRITPPNDAFVTQVIKADANGVFGYTMPFAGWWGFAALLERDAPMAAPDGTAAPVEEGALIWVHATDPAAAR
jgi:cobalt/nickel transport protein